MAAKAGSSDIGLLILRVVPSFIMATHGWAKLRAFSVMSASFPDPLHMGSTLSLTCTIGAEFFCALLVLLGIATRLAAIPLAFTMLVVSLVVFDGATFDKKELPVVYAAIFVALVFTGGGKYALGSKFKRLRRFN